MQKILTSYLRRLTNLSGKNRSLLLLRLLKEQFIDIHNFNYVKGVPSFTIIKDLIAQKDKIFLCNEIDCRDSDTNKLVIHLRRLKRTEAFIFEERGAKDLYIGWPFIEGKFLNNTLVRCPLLFFPVTIDKIGNDWFLLRRSDVNVTLNKTFLLAYFHYNQIQVDEGLVETVIDFQEKDSLQFRTKLYHLLKESELEVHFNTSNFEDELKAFTNQTKAQFESSTQTGRLKMFPQAVLGIFPQSGSYLVPDYKALLERNETIGFDDFFLQKNSVLSSEPIFWRSRKSEENTFAPFSIDASQEKVLKEVKNGLSLVVQGPPGSGKSQLICNLISDFLARGKSVLMVCQKRAALDVVFSRLQQIGIDDFVALVHDFKNDRKPIFDQIYRQINALDTYKKKNISLDAIQLDRLYLKLGRRISQIEEELAHYKKALFDENECGKSIKELYLSCDLDQPAIDLAFAYRHFHFSALKETERKFRSYLDYHQRFEKKSHFWSKRPSYSNFHATDLVKIQKLLSNISDFSNTIQQELEKFCFRKMSFDSAEFFSKHIPAIEEIKMGIHEKVTFKIYKQLQVDKPNKNIHWLTQTERTMMSCFRGTGMETSLKTEQIGRFQEVLSSAVQARKSVFSWVKWLLFSHEKTLLKRVLVANKLKQNKEGFDLLVKKTDNRLNYEHCITLILDNPWLHNFPYSFRKITIQDWFYWQKAGLNLYYVSLSVPSLHEYIPILQLSYKDYIKKLEKLIKLCNKIPKKIEAWNKYLSNNQIQSLVMEKENVLGLKKLLRQDFDAICAYDCLKAELLEEETQCLEKLAEISKNTSDAWEIFENSLHLAWINHIEIKYPELRIVSSGQLDDMVIELRDAIEEKRKINKDILLMKIRERTYQQIEFNRLHNQTTYRDLQHQITKKRRIWPIRKVISEFGDELFNLLPCWMCSPESASAIFPVKEQFDLIIFDEASQCYAEKGVPAMFRGKQIVVAGDSKQLQPSDIYRPRWEDEADDIAALEIDSFLDLTKQHLPEYRLDGHYRSKSLALIEFSNQHFYMGRLKTLPHFNYLNRQEKAIEYVKVDGHWKDGVNLIEAEKVVSIALEYIKNNKDKQIGIITFNYPQREAILDLLEQEAEGVNISLANIFVKNIENVQGDEKDLIIFSIGYAPNPKGKLSVQFGSLNMQGGENRLNVAITRAREKIIICASILPKHLHTDETKNEGPKLFKKYLEFAWNVSQGNWKPQQGEQEPHHINWFLRKKLENSTYYDFKGVEMKKDLPFADISVKSNETYRGLILTDDELYHQSLSAKEIYAYQHEHLSVKNWPNQRFHSREYWLDKQNTQEKLKRFLNGI